MTAPGGRVRIEEGVAFATGGGRELKCDVYIPPDQKPDTPSVLILHGGAWRYGDRAQLRGYGILLGRRGYVCVCSEYRLSDEAKWPAQIEDTKAALRWTRANSAQLGIDPARISVYGMSAGAQLALILAATPNAPEFEGSGGNPSVDTSVAAVMVNYAPTDMVVDEVSDERIEEPGMPGPATALFGKGVSKAVKWAASPLAYVHPDFPPTLLMHGNCDEIVPVQHSLRMHDALLNVGASVEIHTFDGAPHGYDQERGYGRLCSEIMLLFLEKHGLGV